MRIFGCWLQPHLNSALKMKMKKILTISSIIFGGFLFAQNANLKQNFSTSELVKLQNSFPENQKSEFYRQYFRAKIFEDIKREFKYKKYSDDVLKKFTDSVIAGNTSNKIENTDNDIFTPSETFEQFLKIHNDYISQDEIKVRKDFENYSKLKGVTKKDVEDLVEIRLNQINDAKLKTIADLKKEYEDKISGEKEYFENDPLTSRGIEKIIKQIDQNFSKKLQNSEENYQLLAQNSGLFPGQTFPVATSQPEEAAIYETIPGEILTYVTENGYAAGRHYASFKISKNNLILINPIPYENQSFEKKVSKYVKGDWRFEDRAGYEIKKNNNGEYIILTSLYKEDDANCCPSMFLEYKTKDFKNFIPLRISQNDEKPKWIIIK